jgi:hypothetical protein
MMDLRGLLPAIRVSPKATLFPVTPDYVNRAFKDDSTFGAAMEIYSGGVMTDKVIEMVRNNKDFERPVLDLPIDFSYPVNFLVISARGSVRQYSVQVLPDSGEGKFTAFSFNKFFNPDLVRNTFGAIDDLSKTVTVNAAYPVENIAAYKLIPGFETNNARVYLENGTELFNSISLLDFIKPPDSPSLSNPAYKSQVKTVTLKKNGYADAVWTITVNFEEDPDTVRAITDFRFSKAKNTQINADYLATIVHTGDTGTIDVTVYYSGAQQDELRPDFISPGTVTVGGTAQISGLSAQDFSGSLHYTVTSRIGGYIRVYTVRVTLVAASDPLPQINSFSFSTANNPELMSNSSAMIDHAGRLILIEAAYSATMPPYSLIPNFTAGGAVSVNGALQSSGLSPQNFSSPVGYTVTNPSNPTLKREYRVEVRFVQSLSSIAEISSFVFYRADNPGLVADTPAVVNHVTGAISATLLFNTPGGSRTLVPRWTAQGTVEAGGVPQISGVSGREFYSPQTYRVKSADNILQKDYTVTIKEVNSRIYVRQDATGRSDGTNWQNAYANMPRACADAALFPDAVMRELWVAEGVYRPSDSGNTVDYLPVSINTSYIGGFGGTEASAAARVSPESHRAEITGDLGGGRRSNQIFRDSTYSGYAGVCSFEDLIFTHAGDGSRPGAGVQISFSNATVLLKGLGFDDFNGSNGGAVSVYGADITVQDCSFSNTRAGSYGAAYLSTYASGSLGNVTIADCTFTGTRANYAGAIYVYGQNVTLERSTITNSRATGSSCGAVAGGASHNVIVRNMRFDNCIAEDRFGAFYFSGGSSNQTLEDSVFINCNTRNGYPFFYVDNTTVVRNCTFTHNGSLVNPGSPTVSDVVLIFGSGIGTFDGCTFNNIRGRMSGENYLFCRYSEYPGNLGWWGNVYTRGANDELVLRNCTFSFNSGSAGLLLLYAGTVMGGVGNNPDYLLMDNCRINNSGGQSPLLWLISNVPPNTFRFRANNYYNGTRLATASSISGLSAVKLSRLANITMVP